jgi:phosphonate transport system substrate-binding protein
MTTRRTFSMLLAAAALAGGTTVHAADALRFGVGLFQPDRERNEPRIGRWRNTWRKSSAAAVELRTVDTWEGLAKSLANGETDIALMGPWGYVLANHVAGAQVVSTIEYDGKPEYFAIIVTHPESGV